MALTPTIINNLLTHLQQMGIRPSMLPHKLAPVASSFKPTDKYISEFLTDMAYLTEFTVTMPKEILGVAAAHGKFARSSLSCN